MLNSAYKETRGRVISGSFRNSLGKSSESRQYRMLYARNPKNRGNSGEEMRIYANTLAVRDFSENIEVKQKRERESTKKSISCTAKERAPKSEYNILRSRRRRPRVVRLISPAALSE